MSVMTVTNWNELEKSRALFFKFTQMQSVLILFIFAHPTIKALFFVLFVFSVNSMTSSLFNAKIA